MTSIMLSAASPPTLANNARMGHPRSAMGKEKQAVDKRGPPADAKSYGYCSGKGCSNSDQAPKANGDLRSGILNDRMTQGTSGSAAFKQTYTVEGKPANIIWPTKNGNVTATSQTVKIYADRVVIIPEVKQ